MDNSEFQQEKENLHNVLEKYEDIMQFYNSRIDAIPKIYKDDTTMINNSIEMYSEKLRLMKRSIDKPYFARLDFSRDGEEKEEKLYEEIDTVSNADKIIIIIETKNYIKRKINTTRECYICTYPPLEIVDKLN